MTDTNKLVSKSAQSVQDVLWQQGLQLEVIELAASTRTAKEAATTIGCDVAQIVKSLLFRAVQTSQPVLVLASGVNRVNEAVLEPWLGEKVVKADADFTREITGFAIGGVPPVGHKQKINNIFIDENLLKFDKLWAAAGTPNAVFSVCSLDIASLTGGKIIAIN